MTIVITDGVMDNFIQTMESYRKEYRLEEYLQEINRYWADKKSKRKTRKPEPKFTEGFINKLKRHKEQVVSYTKFSNKTSIKKKNNIFCQLIDDFIIAWALYKSSVPPA